MYTEDRNLHYFREISRIPRKSFHEKAVVDYIQRFAEERGLRFQRDTLHNLILWAPATPGREGEAPLMLQAHTDMVCAKEPWSTHDFLKDPIELVEENGWLHANGTTLGADDGAGVANILAILDEPELSHPPLECVFTVQEEDGMGGAKGLDCSLLQSRRMIGSGRHPGGHHHLLRLRRPGLPLRGGLPSGESPRRSRLPPDGDGSHLRPRRPHDRCGAGQRHQGHRPAAASPGQKRRSPAPPHGGRRSHPCDPPGLRHGLRGREVPGRNGTPALPRHPAAAAGVR